jgi:hypothetical protein
MVEYLPMNDPHRSGTRHAIGEDMTATPAVASVQLDAAIRSLAPSGAARRPVDVNRLLADEAAAYPVVRSHTMGRTGMGRPMERTVADAARHAIN